MKNLFKKWLKGDEAVAAIEAGFLFPVMLLMMLGTIDVGMGLTISQKVINSCNTFADLLARQTDADGVNNADLSDAYTGAQLVIGPYSLTPFQYDAVGIQFVGATLTPTAIWRATCKMTANASAVTNAAGLGAQNEGVIAVTVKYIYTPVFTSFVTGNFNMQEVSYARGRKGGFVIRTGNTTPC